MNEFDIDTIIVARIRADIESTIPCTESGALKKLIEARHCENPAVSAFVSCCYRTAYPALFKLDYDKLAALGVFPTTHRDLISKFSSVFNSLSHDAKKDYIRDICTTYGIDDPFAIGEAIARKEARAHKFHSMLSRFNDSLANHAAGRFTLTAAMNDCDSDYVFFEVFVTLKEDINRWLNRGTKEISRTIVAAKEDMEGWKFVRKESPTIVRTMIDGRRYKSNYTSNTWVYEVSCHDI